MEHVARFICILLCVLASTRGVQARLGETTEELEKRFGKPLQASPAGVGDLRQNVYLNGDLLVTILITQNESVLEQYVKLKEKPKDGQTPVIVPFEEALAVAILKANDGGSEWEVFGVSEGKKRYLRKDKKGFATFVLTEGKITEVRVSSRDMSEFIDRIKGVR